MFALTTANKYLISKMAKRMKLRNERRAKGIKTGEVDEVSSVFEGVEKKI